MPTHHSFLMIQCALAVALLTILSFVSFTEIHKQGHGSCFLFATYDNDRLGLKLSTDAQPCQDWILREAAVFICTLVLWFVIEARLDYGSNMKYKTALQLLQVMLLVFMLILAVACSAVITYTLSHICSSRHQSQSRSNFACSDLYFYNSDGEPVFYHTKIKMSEITSWLGAALIFSMLYSTLSSVDYHCTNGCGCFMRHLWCILSESLLLGYQQIRDKLPSAPSFTTAFADCNLLQTLTHTAHSPSVQTPTPVPIAQTHPPTITPVPIHTIPSQPLTKTPSQPTIVLSQSQSEPPPSSEHPQSILDESTDCADSMVRTTVEDLSVEPSAPPLLLSREAPLSYNSMVQQTSDHTTTQNGVTGLLNLVHQVAEDEITPTSDLGTSFADCNPLQTPTHTAQTPTPVPVAQTRPPTITPVPIHTVPSQPLTQTPSQPTIVLSQSASVQSESPSSEHSRSILDESTDCVDFMVQTTVEDLSVEPSAPSLLPSREAPLSYNSMAQQTSDHATTQNGVTGLLSVHLGHQVTEDELTPTSDLGTSFADCNLLQTLTHTAHPPSAQTPTPVPVAQTCPPTITPVPIHTVPSQPLTQTPSQPTIVLSQSASVQYESLPSSEHPQSILDESTDCVDFITTENLTGSLSVYLGHQGMEKESISMEDETMENETIPTQSPIPISMVSSQPFTQAPSPSAPPSEHPQSILDESTDCADFMVQTTVEDLNVKHSAPPLLPSREAPLSYNSVVQQTSDHTTTQNGVTGLLHLVHQVMKDEVTPTSDLGTSFADCSLLHTLTHTAHTPSVQTPTPVPVAQTLPPTITPVPIHTVPSQPLTQTPSQPTTVLSQPQSEPPPSSEHLWSVLDESTDFMAQTTMENLSVKPSAPPLLPSTKAPPSYDSVVHQVSNYTTTRHARNRAMSSLSVYLDHQGTGDELAPTPSLATPFTDWVLLQTPTDMVVHPQTVTENRSFTLPCHYTPLFGVHRVQAHIKSIQQKHNVEFTLLNQAGISISIQSLNKTVADLFFAKTSGIRKVEDCLSDFLTPSSLRKFIWLWQNDQGGFSPYDPDINAILEAIYDASPEGFANNGDMTEYEVGNYTIDFVSMTQTNRQTGRKRMIKYEAVAIVWQYKNSQGNYVSHSHSHSEAIERMYINEKLVPLSIQGETFTFNFHSMVQIGTGGPLSIQRKISSVIIPTAPCKLRLQVQGPSASRLDFAITDFKKKLTSFLCSKEHLVSGSSGLHSPTASGVSPTMNRTANRPQVQGPSASKLDAAVTNLKKKLTRFLDSKKHGSSEHYSPTASVLNTTLSRTVQTILLQKARHYFVSTLITAHKINLLGTKEQVDKVMLLLRQLLLRVVPCSHSQRYHSLQAFKEPSHWSPQTGDFTLVQVNIRTSEVGRLLDLFYATLPNAQIHRIDRIQNLWLWEKYSFAKCRLERKNHGNINEKDLFHGTGSTLPEKVFRSEHGFDFRRANQGLWGEGAYFAVNASYSDYYAHHSAGKKQMILVKVLAGNACYLSSSDSTRKLKQPPVMPSSGQSSASAVFHEGRYDTVRGHSGGSDIYVVYDHDKAYPAYLITYQTT